MMKMAETRQSKLLDPDDVTAAARMWDAGCCKGLHNPHCHKACPSAGKIHRSLNLSVINYGTSIG